MKTMVKSKTLIKAILVIVLYIGFANFPGEGFMMGSIIMAVWGGYKTIQSIYQKRYWDEIIRSAIFSLVGTVGGITVYREALNPNDDFSQIFLLVVGVIIPLLGYSIKAMWKRKGDIKMQKYSMLAFYYFIAIGIFCIYLALSK
ncbi:hypothetical protein [Youngiibacter fragilis]|uniref:Uncharacterized protein n=1 Tax=Youngiibacter fragilis 232.1 TaxID=994573 RepID=V7I9F2_9CLOT|nr:hypothetical protein [Youngiibacter fragilis]ETA81934.1 hypothetical protein T472_0203780 [Youngiibacter fragilis 232.1]